MFKIAKYVLTDSLRNRFLIGYAAALMMVSFGFFYFQGDVIRSLNSLMSIVMFIIPLVTLVFSTTYFYNASEFIELMVSQPVKRSSIIIGEFTGVVVAQSMAYLIGIGIPVLLYAANPSGLTLLLSGFCMSLIFSSLALFAAMLSRDKAKGIGLALMFWLYFTVLYDGIVLAVMFSFSDYPLEKAVILLTALNPVDLGRVLVLLKLDISALMGYTGALYREFFGSSSGTWVVILLMMSWVAVPLTVATRIFRKKNL